VATRFSTTRGSPLERADLALVANAMLEKTEPLRRETLARRHKMVDGSAREVTFPQVQKGLGRLFRQRDENGLSKLIVEIALLGSVESSSQEETDALTGAARLDRVDVEKLRKDIEADFAAKRAKAAATQKKVTAKPAKAAKTALAPCLTTGVRYCRTPSSLLIGPRPSACVPIPRACWR
jgi:hypothetical protein